MMGNSRYLVDHLEASFRPTFMPECSKIMPEYQFLFIHERLSQLGFAI